MAKNLSNWLSSLRLVDLRMCEGKITPRCFLQFIKLFQLGANLNPARFTGYDKGHGILNDGGFFLNEEKDISLGETWLFAKAMPDAVD